LIYIEIFVLDKLRVFLENFFGFCGIIDGSDYLSKTNPGTRCVVKALVKEFSFPIIWELLFICLFILRPFKTLYLFFIYYLVLLVYFRESFSFKDYKDNFERIKGFWLPVVITTIAAFGAYWVKVNLIQRNFFMVDGTYNITWENSYIGEALYALTIMFLGPIVSELFYRKAIMRFDGPLPTAISFFAGLILCAFGSAYLPLGLLEAVLLALPYAVAYLCTKNVYVTITVHIIFMLYHHVPNIIYDVARISLR